MSALSMLGASWSSIFARRLEVSDFTAIGAPSPVFFFSANDEDNAQGRVVDIVSGTSATLLGGASFGTTGGQGFGMDTPYMADRLPIISLGASGALDFGLLPLLASPYRQLVIRGVVRLNNVTNASYAGQPTAKHRTIVARSFSDPSNAHTNMSGWTASFSQYKAATGTASYLHPHVSLIAAVSTTTYLYFGNRTSNGYMWNTTLSQNLSQLHSFLIVFDKNPAGAGVDLFTESPWNSNTESSSESPMGTSVGLTMQDPDDRPLLVGCCKDASTASFNTNFLDGDILCLGIWAKDYRDPWASNTPRTPHRYMQDIFQNIASNRGVLAPRVSGTVPKTFWVDSSVNSTIPKVVAGTFLDKGAVVRDSTDRVFITLAEGTPRTPTVLSRRADTTQTDIPGKAYIGTLPSLEAAGQYPGILVREVTGEAPYFSAANMSLRGVASGDTIKVAPTHRPLTILDPEGSKLRIAEDTVVVNEAMQQTRVVANIYTFGGRRGCPVVLDFSSTTLATFGGVDRYTLGLDGGSYYINGTLPAVSVVNINAYRSRVTLEGVVVGGNSLSLGGSCPIDVHRSQTKPRSRVTVNASLPNMSTPAYDFNDYSSQSIAPSNVGGGLTMKYYGGLISGRALDTGYKYGGVAAYYYGTQMRFRYSSTEVLATIKRFMSIAQLSTGARSRVQYVGGVPARPYAADLGTYLNRKAILDTSYDGLRDSLVNNLVKAPGVLPDAAAITYTTYRNLSPVRLDYRRVGYIARASAAGSILERDAVPVTLRRYCTLASASSIRIYCTLSNTAAAGFAPVVEVEYLLASTGKKKVVHTEYMASIILQSISNSLWTGPYDQSGYFDIPISGAGEGFIDVSLFAIGSAPSSACIDPYFEIIV